METGRSWTRRSIEELIKHYAESHDISGNGDGKNNPLDLNGNDINDYRNELTTSIIVSQQHTGEQGYLYLHSFSNPYKSQYDDSVVGVWGLNSNNHNTYNGSNNIIYPTNLHKDLFDRKYAYTLELSEFYFRNLDLDQNTTRPANSFFNIPYELAPTLNHFNQINTIFCVNRDTTVYPLPQIINFKFRTDRAPYDLPPWKFNFFHQSTDINCPYSDMTISGSKTKRIYWLFLTALETQKKWWQALLKAYNANVAQITNKPWLSFTELILEPEFVQSGYIYREIEVKNYVG